MSLCDEILGMDRGVRFVGVLDKSGRLIEAKSRPDIVGKELMPEPLLSEVGATLTRIVWSVSRRFSEYFGENLRVVFHHKKLDLIVMEVKGNILLVTTEKYVKTDDLARVIRAKYVER